MSPSREPGELERLVTEFHQAHEVPIIDRPALPPPERRALRRRLVEEEFREFLEADDAGDLVAVADALADLLYVVMGTALEYGIPLSEVLREVHRSNMSKLGEDGRPLHREDGKVIKGPNYSPPDLRGVLGLGDEAEAPER